MALKTSVVRVSGRGSNVDFTIDDSAPFEQLTEALQEYLVENRGLWSSGTIGVNAGRWMLSPDRLGRIKHIIESGSGLTVGRFWCSPNNLDSNLDGVGRDANGAPSNGSAVVSDVLAAAPPAALEDLVEELALSQAARPKLKEPKAGSSRKGMPSEALFVKATFRSGESISHAGDVVVLADVNPGAEISAEGDIVVFGRLRGLAHAGSGGDSKAAIIALELDSPRIQIGPYIGLAPVAGARSKILGAGPQIAYARRRSIHVSPYTGRFARYSRGILYDG